MFATYIFGVQYFSQSGQNDSTRSYSRGSYFGLPATDTTLTTPYSDSDYIDVTSKNDVRVCQGSNDYALHQYKDLAYPRNSIGDFAAIEWEGQTDLAPSTSPVYLQIYNRTTETWETIDQNGVESASTDFTLEATLNDLTDYLNVEMMISCRVYQSSIPVFKFQVEYATPFNFVLPIYDGGDTYNHNFTVNWGDGSPDSTITSFDDTGVIHTYVSSGTYVITMTGLCEYFSFDGFTGAEYIYDKITKLLDFVGDPGFKVLNFYSCINLNTIIPLGTKESLTNLAGGSSGLFTDCFSITSIPVDMFKYNPNVTNFASVFAGCPITSIPTDLFKYNTAAVSFAGAFASCTALTSIPTDLFKYNTAVEDFSVVFYNCSGITSVPTDLFKYNTVVDNFNYAFYNCSGIASIPATLFLYNTAATKFEFVLHGGSYTSIPADLFRYNTAAATFYEAFGDNASLTSIPADLFRYNTAVTNFSYTFSGCSVLASTPVDLFRYNTAATDFSGVFNECINLTLNTNIFWEDGARDTRFYDQSINFEFSFNRSSFTGSQGTSPDIWNCDFGTGTPTKTYCFGGAGNSLTSLTNYASIPGAWL